MAGFDLQQGTVRGASVCRTPRVAASMVVALLLLLGGPAARVQAQSLHAAVLPSEAPHFVYSERNNPQATFFATLINASEVLLQNCRVEMATELPFLLDYQVTERAQNRAVGPPNTPAAIAAGASQTFRFSLRLREQAAIDPQALGFRFTCDGAVPAAVVTDINTVRVSAGAPRLPELLSAIAVPSGTGVLQLEGGSDCRVQEGTQTVPCAFGAYAFALLNTAPNPVALSVVDVSEVHEARLCRTDEQAKCLGPAVVDEPLTLTLAAGELATFSTVLVSVDDFAFNPFDSLQSAGFVAQEIRGSDLGAVLAEQTVRLEADAFEWSARRVALNASDVLQVQGSLWVGSSCQQPVLRPLFEADLPADELHFTLSSEATGNPELSCAQVVVKRGVRYESDTVAAGINRVVIRFGAERLVLSL